MRWCLCEWTTQRTSDSNLNLKLKPKYNWNRIRGVYTIFRFYQLRIYSTILILEWWASIMLCTMLIAFRIRFYNFHHKLVICYYFYPVFIRDTVLPQIPHCFDHAQLPWLDVDQNHTRWCGKSPDSIQATRQPLNSYVRISIHLFGKVTINFLCLTW